MNIPGFIGEPDEEAILVYDYTEEEIGARMDLANAETELAKLEILHRVDAALQPFRDFAAKIAGTATKEQCYTAGKDGIFADLPMSEELWAEWRALTGISEIPKEMFYEGSD